MAEINLVAEAPRPLGSRAAGRLRASGRIPGVIYGHGIDPLPISVDGRSLRAALTTGAGLNALLALQVGSETHLTLAREIQRHPVRSTVVHVDFLVVRRDEIVSAEVPINLVGEARKVAQNDGLIEHQLTSLTVHATPANIPSHIEVDISNMDIGDTIRVSDIALPTGVSTDLDPEEPVVIAARGGVDETAEAVEGEEGAESAASPDGAGAASGG